MVMSMMWMATGIPLEKEITTVLKAIRTHSKEISMSSSMAIRIKSMETKTYSLVMTIRYGAVTTHLKEIRTKSMANGIDLKETATPSMEAKILGLVIATSLMAMSTTLMVMITKSREMAMISKVVITGIMVISIRSLEIRTEQRELTIKS